MGGKEERENPTPLNHPQRLLFPLQPAPSTFLLNDHLYYRLVVKLLSLITRLLAVGIL